MKLTALALSLLLSTSLQSKLGNHFNNRAQQYTQHQCTQAITTFKKGPADYKKFITNFKQGTTAQYTDPDFSPNSGSIWWSDYARTSPYSLQSIASSSQWFRPEQKYSGVSLFNGIGANDIVQGYINDCFILSPSQASAERNGRIDDIILNTKYPSEGIVALNLNVKGKPAVITIDTALPFYGNSLPAFSRRSGDGDFWMSFLEKGFAKLHGNYESLGGGWQAETWRILNGAPTRFITMASINNDANSAWSTISQALSQNFMVGVDTGSSPPFGLAGGHAYSVLGAYSLKDTQGNVKARLLRVRNPWGYDSYSGPWSDNDSRWTTAFKSQVPFNQNTNDGYFFIEVSDFMNAFSYFQVNYVHDDWFQSYYERKSDDGQWKSYTFTLSKQQDVFIGVDFYNPRMYASGCRGGQLSKGQFNLLKGSTVLDRYAFDDRLGYGWTQYTGLSAGTYTIQVLAQWTSFDVRDYVVSVYAPDSVIIYDQNGYTSFDAPPSQTADLQFALTQALKDLSPYAVENGGWYTLRQGYYDTPQKNRFFFQLSGPMGIYNLDMTASFTTFDGFAVVSANARSQSLTTVRNADGSTTVSHNCQVLPKAGINECSYLVYTPDANSGVKWSWKLNSWTYA